MEQRLDYFKLAPDAARAMHGVGTYLAGCGLEHALLELVKIRASQLNEAGLLHRHAHEGRHAAGETKQRIYALERLARGTIFHRARAVATRRG